MTNTALWEKLGKTDPAQTKDFKRCGGFSGTALKPMWVWKRLTEDFGPFGVGWGCFEPSFQVVPAGKETLVYCTVSAWHGDPKNMLWGVGGDKVLTQNKNGDFADDEAFKKAFTDALMNAFKFLGVGADIHMGMFDDNKYVEQMRIEFGEAESAAVSAAKVAIQLCKSAGELEKWAADNKQAIDKLDESDTRAVRKAYATQLHLITTTQKEAA